MNWITGKSPGAPKTRFLWGARRHVGAAWHPTVATRFRRVAAGAAIALPMAMLAPSASLMANAAVAPVGQGFTVTPSDLAFILKQIKIAERHAATLTPANPCGTLVGPGPDQIPDRLSAYGLRTVDGSCNNLFPGRETFATADQPFPRLTTPRFRAAEPITPALPVGPPGPTSYAQKLANNVVIDSQPRVISNLIVDQTSTNPAAVQAAGFPVRTQGNTGVVPCTTDPDPAAGVVGVPAGCTPSHKTLFIPNVTTDVGLSPPYNSLFTFFGQFFDHGVDQTVKSGGTVFVPLRADDPLRTLGPDGKAGTGDEVPASQAFMVLTRGQNQPGPDKILGTADDIQDANNTDSPWVDQSQTYTSHASHQVFLREYVLNSLGRPVSTGKLLGGLPAGAQYAGSPDGRDGIGTWKAVKIQAATRLGLLLTDADVTNIPMLATDPYGKFIPGPARGLPQYVTATGLVEGNTAAPVPVPANVVHFDTPFLTDIAHNADPSPDPRTGVRPTPDADAVPSADFAHQPAGTYDDEMLDMHFACGDGRCNENIALSAIHQIFHSEHDRLVDDIKNTLTNDTSPAGVAALAEWKLAVAQNPAGWNGERLFQAARFVTEMEYQHLVFEEFARKMQPLIRPFHVYNPDINAAIPAEFAHAVYRFGHSMLDDDVARTNVVTGADNTVPLLTAFLNPPEYYNGGGQGITGTLTPQQAAGQIVMGSADQVGNELDEFVTETLRNNLLGLPLDLPSINMTRARSEGIPPLNDVRRQIFAQTNDGQLAPYTSWTDFGQHLKHPASLINFVAAYGTHPTIRDAGPDGISGNADDVTTIAAKRAAAKLIVDPPAGAVPPADAADFMFSTGAWATPASGVTTTGLDSVDLWVGGLAEVTNLFGGLLGSTFNYVFQTSLENLQDFDRLYYLNRTPGMNLRTQLEGNSFSEMIQRNTDGTNTLKADAFATADCKFQMSFLNNPVNSPNTVVRAATPTVPASITGAGSLVDDPSTPDCDENLLLLKQPNGTIQYRQFNSVDPPGINGQSVYNGTAAVDRIFGGNDNDTFWGGAGNDIIEGNGGDDVALGGDGNDIITDLSGADVEKGGPGNDALDGGIGDDIFMGGDGQDFINGGANDNETFAGPGNDFIIAGQGADAVFGDGGDDWIEGGSGQDLLQGDHGAPFFDDPGQVAPGNDIFVGQVGENDYDAEGGDDIMSQNAAIDRNAGAAGFDWAIHQYDTVGADDDMEINNNLVGVPIQVVVNRDRWQETEANSGSAFNDVIRGTSTAPITIGGAGFAGCDVLDQAGLNRISGLQPLLPALTGDAAPVVAASAAGFCPVTGPVWGDGDILIGGAGNDTLEGRGADDIIDGDKALSVRISVRNAAGVELGSTDLMEGTAKTGTFGPGTTGMTLQQAVFAGLVDPGNLVAVRQITAGTAAPDCSTTAPAPTATSVNCDTAVFSGPLSNYSITSVAASGTTLASIRVTQTGANVVGQKVSDGVDTLRNIELLKFSDGTVPLTVPNAPTSVTATATAGAFATGSATVTWVAPAATASPVTSFTVVVRDGATVVQTITGIPATATSRTVTGLVNGTTYTLSVSAVTALGTGPEGTSNAVTPRGLPGAPTGVTATAGNAQATVNWLAPASDGGSAVTSYTLVVRSGATVVRTVTGIAPTARTSTQTALTNGTAYTLSVNAVNAFGNGTAVASNTVTPVGGVPGAPRSVTATATSGATTTGSATVSWLAPLPNGSAAITSYTVVVRAGTTVVRTVTGIAPTATSSTQTGLTNGTAYTLSVNAVNAAGAGAVATSAAVTPRGLPGVPTGVTATPGPSSATVGWVAPANGGSVITSYRIQAVRGGVVVGTVTTTGAPTTWTITGLLNGSAYTFRVQAVNAFGASALSAPVTVTPRTVPGAPTIGTAVSGVAGGTVTATANWTAPAATGGSPITGYRVSALRMAADGVTVLGTTVVTVGSTLRTASPTLAAGNYRFSVQAVNAAGNSAASARSNLVTAR
ncbi:peroxidase family protein [Terrabacter terrigena]|uniref:Peroxidase family protein n=1 Tax=Terrabacter terrigena TaxID=574718 RepID=A0ABW3MXG4_9MICO